MTADPLQPGLGSMLRNMADPERWRRFLEDAQRAGVLIDPAQSGGFNPRNIAGTNTPSQHSFGRAFDLNWNANPRGPVQMQTGEERLPSYDPDVGMFQAPQPVMPANIARDLAARHGMVWGGDWSNPDPMHFEFRRGDAVPMGRRSITDFAGNAAPQPTPPPPSNTAVGGSAYVDHAAGLPVGSAAPQPAPAPTPIADDKPGNDGSSGRPRNTYDFGAAMANAIPDVDPRPNPAAMGLLTSMAPPAPAAPPSWVSSPFQRRDPRMARFSGQYGR